MTLLLEAAPRRRRADARAVRPAPAPRPAPVPVRPGEPDEAVALLASASTMLALVCLGFVVQLVFLSGLSHARAQHLLFDRLRTDFAAGTASMGPVTEPGAPVALLSISKLGLQQVVVEGTAAGDLQAGPGHRRDTVLPGQAGISLVYGRAHTYGAPFRDLGSLQPGDQVVAQTQQGRTVFTVSGVRRAGDRLPAPPTGTQARLTLVSSEGAGPVGRLGAASTVYVDAVAEKGLPAPAGIPRALPASERAMAPETGALPMLALALALLLGLTAAVTWARRRWAAPLIWVIASPIALALAWFTSDTAVRLLPNLL